jgi:hypothetical protein
MRRTILILRCISAVCLIALEYVILRDGTISSTLKFCVLLLVVFATVDTIEDIKDSLKRRAVK